MNFLTFAPSFRRARPGRVELALSPYLRLLYLGLGGTLLVVLSRSIGSNSPLAIMFAIVIGLAALGEERWIFDGESGELRKRFGLLILSKSWAISADEVSSIEFDSDCSGMTGADPYGAVRISPPRNSCALRVTLANGKALTMYVLPKKHAAKLAEYGREAAQAIGRPFIES